MDLEYAIYIWENHRGREFSRKRLAVYMYIYLVIKENEKRIDIYHRISISILKLRENRCQI